MARTKQKNKVFEVPYDENKECERCKVAGSYDIVGEQMCFQCILNDVFDDPKPQEN